MLPQEIPLLSLIVKMWCMEGLEKYLKHNEMNELQD